MKIKKGMILKQIICGERNRPFVLVISVVPRGYFSPPGDNIGHLHFNKYGSLRGILPFFSRERSFVSPTNKELLKYLEKRCC